MSVFAGAVHQRLDGRALLFKYDIVEVACVGCFKIYSGRQELDCSSSVWHRTEDQDLL